MNFLLKKEMPKVKNFIKIFYIGMTKSTNLLIKDAILSGFLLRHLF